ncbi:sugar ABC transporter substrate-binding protein [Ectobacillus funiculus]|uniref:Sugar ABC transporter substrate-binding protein n=1 Tax=Ectobacillus funiculus TaxID=137993 RepID=A0ABV5W9X9_9BACI
MKKSWIVSLACAILFSAFIGYMGKSFAKEDRPKVVVILKSLNTDYWKSMKAGADQAFADFDVDGKVIAPASEYRVTEQITMLKNVLKQQPDALIVAPSQPSAAIPILAEYHKKHIPVLLADTDAEWKDQTTFIGTDNSTLGKKAGELLGSLLYPRDQVAIIEGTSVSTVTSERVKGAKEALEAAGIEIVTEQPGYDEFGNVKSVMESILQAHPDIKGVFATDDTITLAALKVIEKRGLKIPVVGTDGIRDMIKSIQARRINASVAQNPYDMGYIGVEQALRAINGETVVTRIDSGVDIITTDNAKEKLDFLKTILKPRYGLLQIIQ